MYVHTCIPSNTHTCSWLLLFCVTVKRNVDIMQQAETNVILFNAIFHSPLQCRNAIMKDPTVCDECSVCVCTCCRRTCVFMQVYAFVCVCVCNVCVCVFMQVYAFVCVYVCVMCVYVCVMCVYSCRRMHLCV